jgi:hypothetical protein
MEEMEGFDGVKKVEKGASFHDVTVSHAILLNG